MASIPSVEINVKKQSQIVKKGMSNFVPAFPKKKSESYQKTELDLCQLLQLSGLSQYFSHFYFQGWVFDFWELGWDGEPVWVYYLQTGEIKRSGHHYKLWSLVKGVAMKIRNLVREIVTLNEPVLYLSLKR